MHMLIRPRGKHHLGGHGCPMMPRSTANSLSGSQRDNRVVTLKLLVLTFRAHGCELWNFQLVHQLELAQNRHVRFDTFWTAASYVARR